MSQRPEKMEDNFLEIFFMLPKEKKVTEDYYKTITKPNDNPNYVEYDPLIHGWRGQEPRRNFVPPVSVAPKREPDVILQPSGQVAEETNGGVAEAGQLLGEASSPRRMSKFNFFCQCFGKK